MTSRDRNSLVRIVKDQKTAKIKNIITEFQANNGTKLGRTTIHSELNSMGYRRQALRKKVIIRSKNIKKRLRWAKEGHNWSSEKWKDFIFSDECSVVIWGDRRVYCWRTEDEKDRPQKVAHNND